MCSSDLDDIFTRNPFKITKEQGGVFKYKLNHWDIIRNLLIYRKSTLGDTSKLRYKTLPKFITEEIYNNIINACQLYDKEIVICVTNFTLRERQYIDLHKCGYEDFLDWLWASTSAPPFMSIVEKDNYEWIDGGVMTMVPLKEAVLRGADIIDCVVLQEEKPSFAIEKTRNLLHFIINLLYMQMDYRMMENSDLSNIVNHVPFDKKIIVNFHYTEKKLTNNALMFDQENMRKWWVDGYNYAKEGRYKSYLVDRTGFELLDNKKGDRSIF